MTASRWFLSFLLLSLTGCRDKAPAAEPTPAPTAATSFPMAPAQPSAAAPVQPAPSATAPVLPPAFLPEERGSASPALRAADRRAVEALARRDLAGLSSLVGPDGLRFSPYGHVTKADVTLSARELSNALRETKPRHWGEYDGSGEPIELAFSAYYDKFVYDAPFGTAPIVGLGVRVAGGNTLDNLAEFYPGAVVVEHYFPATDDGGMNWRALRLVFRESSDKWQLLGLAHVAWTI